MARISCSLLIETPVVSHCQQNATVFPHACIIWHLDGLMDLSVSVSSPPDRPPAPVNVSVMHLRADSATVSWEVPEGDIIIGFSISQQASPECVMSIRGSMEKSRVMSRKKNGTSFIFSHSHLWFGTKASSCPVEVMLARHTSSGYKEVHLASVFNVTFLLEYIWIKDARAELSFFQFHLLNQYINKKSIVHINYFSIWNVTVG